MPFDRELSLIVCRDAHGAFAFYPPAENMHRAGILVRSESPALEPNADGPIACVRRMCDQLGYVGVLAVEFFDRGGGWLANEMAPRVHNTGHWTIEGSRCSQFENHVRTVMGLPLESTASLGHAVMLNVIGQLPDPGTFDDLPDATLHAYGKAAKPGRKLGHVTVRHDEPARCRAIAAEAESRLVNVYAGP